MKKIIVTWCMLAVGLASVCAQAGYLDSKTDCSQREDEAKNPEWSCIKASDWIGQCVPGWLFQEWNCLELDESAVLCDEQRSYDMTVYLTTSNVNFDCNGQVIEHHWQDDDSRRSGIRVSQERSISNINLSNCELRNVGRYGINLKRFFRGSELDGEMTGHSNIYIEDFDIVNPRQTGIYVGQNSRQITIDDVYIERAYTGVYLEAGSAYTHIKNSTIVSSTHREAISLDSSIFNTIENCTFENNIGGIHLYKNCGETSGQVCPIRRKYSASYNTIRNNVFFGDDVEVAWRQYKLYAVGHCIGIDFLGFWRDHSNNNLIYENAFYNSSDLHVKDGPNTVYKNQFENSDLILGKTAPLGDSPFDLTGTVAENRFEQCSIELNTNDDIFEQLEVFNNIDYQNVCMNVEGMNECGGPTVLWGNNILSAGVISLLFV